LIGQYICDVARFLAQRNFITTSSGQISMRDQQQPHVWWTFPLGINYVRCKPSHLVCMEHGKSPSNHTINPAALVLHEEIYKQRPDVNAILHYHPVNTVSWSTTHLPLPLLTQESSVFYKDLVNVPFDGVIESPDESRRIVKAIGNCNSAILDNHGSITMGTTIGSAAYRMILLEQCCEIALKAGPRAVPIGEDVAERLHGFFTRDMVLEYQFNMYWKNNE
jgi:ribulose-5-phosphate 4-epimerase/fuculose-1-phosphate aldolase